MEFINQIRLRGVVGRAEVNAYNGNRVCNFSVVTEYYVPDKEHNSTVEPTWFNVSYWEDRNGNALDLYELQKGQWVELLGRLRVRKYMTQDNEERTSMDVLARSVQILDRDGGNMQPQRDR